MKIKRILSLVLCLCMLSSFFTIGYATENTELIDDEDYEIELFTQDRSSYFNKNYTLTGNPAKDIVIVAKAQLNSDVNLDSAYTEPWCANFATDCARLTGMSDKIIPYNYSSRGACRYLINKMLNDCNAVRVSTPKEGDLVFYYCATCDGADGNKYPHVGIVMDSSYSIEGNCKVDSIWTVKKVSLTSGFKDKYGHSCVRQYIRPNYGNTKQILSTPNINLNNKKIGTSELNAENKISCKVGDDVVFGWEGVNGATNYSYAVLRLPVGYTPNPNDNNESAMAEWKKTGEGKESMTISLSEPGIYKFAVWAVDSTGTYDNSTSAKVYLKVDASGNANTSAPTNVKAKLSSNHVEEGETFTFSVSADNATACYAKFFKNDGTAVWPKYEKISGSEQLSVPSAGVYYFESYAENDYGKTNANTVYLTVTEKDSGTDVTPTPPSSSEGVLTIKATESSLAPYPCQYTDVNGKLVSGDLQRIWPTTYSCDSSVLSWEAWPNTMCYQIAVRDLASNELVYEAYEYYDTKLEIGKLFRVDAPVRVWVAARDYQKKILAQGTATYYMHKPTMEWTNPNQKEYYLIGEKMPVNISATGFNNA